MLKLSKCAFSLTVIVVALSGCVSDRHSYPSQNRAADADTVAYFTDAGLNNSVSGSSEFEALRSLNWQQVFFDSGTDN